VGGKASGIPPYFPFIVSAVAFVIALGFWGLDWRNVQMVHVDERALEEIEQLVSEKFQFKHFEMSKKWEEAPLPWLIRYRIIANGLFIVIAVISALAAGRDFYFAFCKG
jgi:hypothetical protein